MSSSRPPRAFNRVVVPLDGSQLAESALRTGFAIAQRGQVGVTVVHALDGRASDPAEREAELRAAAARFDGVVPFEVTARRGGAAEVILAVAEEQRALICMASHGRGGLSRLALGSVAEEIVRRSATAVIVCGPYGASTPLPDERAEVLVCTDGSEFASGAVPATIALAHQLQLRVVVAQSIPPDEDVSIDGTPPPQPLLDAARANCDAMVRAFGEHGIDARGDLLFGDAVRSVAGRARSLPAAFVAVASHGRSGLERLAIESTAAALVRTCPCPLLLVGPAARRHPETSRR
jgi:nucleotide-binding universal stress UspA family protein